MIDDDIYSKIIELKAKSEIIKWTGIAVTLTKEYGQVNTFMSIMLLTKITLDMWTLVPFHKKSGVTEVEKMCGRIAMCKCAKSCNKTTYFCLKTNSIEKKYPKLLIALGDFLYKVWIVQYSFSKFVFGDN